MDFHLNTTSIKIMVIKSMHIKRDAQQHSIIILAQFTYYCSDCILNIENVNPIW